MRIKIEKKDVIWNYLGTFMSLASNIIMLPFLIYFLDGNMLGLWYIFTSIGAIATLFDFGFGVTFARNITYSWSGVSSLKKEGAEFTQNQEIDYKLMKNVLLTCRRIYLIIAGAALILMLTAGTGYLLMITTELNDKTYLVAWIIYALSIFLNLYYGYFASFLRGVGAINQANKNTINARCIQIVATVITLFLGWGLIGACVANLLYGTIFRYLGKKKFYNYKDIGKNLANVTSSVSKAEMKELFITVWHNAWREGVITICNYLSNQASTLICSMYFSLAETGIYSLGVQIASAISTVAAALYSAYQPALQESYVIRDKEKTRNIMSLIVFAYIVIFVVGFLGAAFVGLPLLRLIKPESIVSVPVLLGISVYQFILKFRNCYTSYFSCTNRICYMKAFLVAAGICVALSFGLIGGLQWGIWGLIVAQIISQAIYNMWVWTVRAHREMEMSFSDIFTRGWSQCISLVKR